MKNQSNQGKVLSVLGTDVEGLTVAVFGKIVLSYVTERVSSNVNSCTKNFNLNIKN